METWTSHLTDICSTITSSGYHIPHDIRLGTDAFMVPSPDGQDLIFTFPLLMKSNLSEEIPLPLSSSAGAVHAIIEYCKRSALKNKDLEPLCGKKSSNMSRYTVNVEPCTIASSPSSIASNLWRPDEQNYLLSNSIRLSVRGAIPFAPLTTINIKVIRDILETYVDELVKTVNKTPVRQLTQGWETVQDQQCLRSYLDKNGYICFIGDGTRPARTYTKHRSWHRVAGPKDGVHIPFYCPVESSPIEITLEGSQKTITGLGIKREEILAITGSNAEGKSTLLSAIQAGEDDHAPGDGREYLVTIPGGVAPDATNIELLGGDLRPFFKKIPPGMTGTPDSVFGQGSGSASMASRISDAIRKQVPYIIIDEDRAAQNLMVPCYMSSPDVQSLATLLADHRDWLHETSLIIAGSGLELLIAQADRIIRLEKHRVYAQSVTGFREGLRDFFDTLSKFIP